MTSYSILHISDLHLSVDANSANRPYAWFDPKGLDVELAQNPALWRPHTYCSARALGLALYVKELAGAFDLTVLSGDAATTGLEYDLDAAIGFIVEKPGPGLLQRTTRGSLFLPGESVLLVPGNHDRYAREWQSWPFYVPGNELCDEKYKRHRLWHGTLHGTDYAVVRREPPLLIVAGDFCLGADDDGGGQFFDTYGQGRVCETALRNLVRVTNGLAEVYKPAAILWCIHFYPLQSPDGLKLLEAEKLLSAANACNISLILCGHIHEMKADCLDDRLLIFSAGSATAIAAPLGHMFHLLTLEVTDDQRSLNIRIDHFKWKGGRFKRNPPPDHPFTGSLKLSNKQG